MKNYKQILPVQQLATGEMLSVYAYVFNTGKPGPKIYLQANLHGPEIFGTTLLGELVTHLEKQPDIPGTIIIVPVANPVAVQASAYNALVGRWNMHNGVNWNRIFNTHIPFSSLAEQKQYYENLLQMDNLSIENKLAATLKILSTDATHIIDIHTTGTHNTPHVFTHALSSQVFYPLNAKVHITWDKADTVGAFDESHIAPFLGNMPTIDIPHACTWEVYHHGENNWAAEQERFTELRNWLQSVWNLEIFKSTASPLVFPVECTTHLVSEIGGYYTWKKQAGDRVNTGEEYASVYQPWHHKTVSLRAKNPFVVMGIYGVQAIGSGEQIAWIGHV